MAKKIKRLLGADQVIDCACLIHDTMYDWTYVDRLYNSLCRNLTPEVRLHVFTESNRHVPKPYVRHDIEEWDRIRGPKSSWWYKIQLFNEQHDIGQMLYFDLDTVIVGNIDWLWQVDRHRLWAARDFKYLMKSSRWTANSSVMWFDPHRFRRIYREFDHIEILSPRCRWHGDQDYITEKAANDIAYYSTDRILSYRWQVAEGGYDFRYRKPLDPGGPSKISENTSVLIFHGLPKPHEVKDPLVLEHWR